MGIPACARAGWPGRRGTALLNPAGRARPAGPRPCAGSVATV